MCSLLCLFVALVVSHFGLEGGTLVLNASVSGHCLPYFVFTVLDRFSPLQVFSARDTLAWA